MTLQELASLIAFREGKRSQVAIGDIREILKIICVLAAEDMEQNGCDQTNCPLVALTAGMDKEIDRLRKKKK